MKGLEPVATDRHQYGWKNSFMLRKAIFKGFGNEQFLSYGSRYTRYLFKSSLRCGLSVLSGLGTEGGAAKAMQPQIAKLLKN